MENQRNVDLICFGGNDWWYHNRNHFDIQMLRCYAQYGNSIYVNSIVMQKPNVSQGRKFIRKLVRKARSIFHGLKKSSEGFWVYSPFSLPVHHIRWLRPLNKMLLQFQLWLVTRKLGIQNPVVWVACPAACDVAMNMKRVKLVYQRTDRFEEYPDVDAETIRRYDQKLKANADLTIFASSSLYEEECKQCKKALYIDHGVDYSMFARAEKLDDVPKEMREMKRPVVGFFGEIEDHTCDVGFIEKLVELMPEISFVFIGKAMADCSGLMGRKNVWMLGKKPYEQIPHYGKCFDVAIMPWRQNRWIQACNPIKLKEYLALGKPVVSTPFPELRTYRDVVYEAKTPEEFADCIKKAHFENNAELVAKRRQKVAQTSWDSKAELVLRELFNENESNLKGVDR